MLIFANVKGRSLELENKWIETPLYYKGLDAMAVLEQVVGEYRSSNKW